jgi:hypothetical protein
VAGVAFDGRVTINCLPARIDDMSNELRDKFYGYTIEERLARVPGELQIDAVGLWQIVSFGRQGFDLSGEALADYTRRNILALLDKGAKPVVAVANAIHGRVWLPVDYGNAQDQIANAIIREWLEEGVEPNFRVWFALPHLCLES